MNTTKLELCNRVAQKFGKQPAEFKKIFEAFIDEIFEVMAEDSRIEIRGFGCFQPKKREKRLGRNPRTGETVDIPAYTAPAFKFSKEAQKVFEDKLKKQKRKKKKEPDLDNGRAQPMQVKSEPPRTDLPPAAGTQKPTPATAQSVSRAAQFFSPK